MHNGTVSPPTLGSQERNSMSFFASLLSLVPCFHSISLTSPFTCILFQNPLQPVPHCEDGICLVGHTQKSRQYGNPKNSVWDTKRKKKVVGGAGRTPVATEAARTPMAKTVFVLYSAGVRQFKSQPPRWPSG